MRKIALLLHRWTGLVLGTLIAVLGVTGSLLVYEEEIDEALNPGLFAVEPGAETLPPGRALASARAASPGLEPDLVRLPVGRTDPYVFHGPARGDGARRSEVFVDPHTGRVLGRRPENGGVVGTLFRVHANLLGGAAGRQAVGWLGVALLLLCLTGAVVWWPRTPRLRRLVEALGVRRDAGPRRTNYDLHRAGGAWTLAYLAVLALTGAGLVFYGTTGRLLDTVTDSRPMPPPPASAPERAGSAAEGAPPLGRDPAALDRAWRDARSALPKAAFTYLILPSEPDGAVAFRGRMPGELHPNGRSFVWYDRWTGERLRVDDATRADLGPRLLHALYPVHIGAFPLGPLEPRHVRLAWAALGLAPALLMVTGFLVWWWRGRGGARRGRSAA